MISTMAATVQLIERELVQDPTFTIAIPAYNEEAGLGDTLSALVSALDSSIYEVLVVDDGSTDATPQIASQFPSVRLIQHQRNQGYSAAIRSATIQAKGKFIIWFDSDGQHRTDDLLGIAKLLETEDLDWVIGQRDSRSHEVFNRRFGKAVLRYAVRLAASKPISDYNCGLRGFRRSVLVRYLHLLPTGFGASTTTTLLMLERNYRGRFFPVVILQRIGKSTVRQVRDGLRTLMLILRIFLIFKPMMFFGSVGAVAVAAGSVYGLVEAFAYRQGFPVLAAAVILFGFQSLFFGLICDQIAGMRRESMDQK